MPDNPYEREDEERHDAYEFDAALLEREDERHDWVRLASEVWIDDAE